jgi:hypothetical protein
MRWANLHAVAPIVMLAVVASGCGDAGTAPPPATDQVTCDARSDASGMCIVSLEPLSDTRRLSLISRCRESGGRVVDSCPTDGLVGVCQIEENTAQAWTLNARTRVHHYLHADLRTPAAVEALAGRCSGPSASWTPAAPVE